MGWRNLAMAEKNVISEVSCEDHVGDFLQLARRKPQRICSEGWNYQCSVLQRCNGKAPKRIRRVRPGMCESGDWFLLHHNASFHNAAIVYQFLAQQKVTVLEHPPYLPDLAPADYFLFPKCNPTLWLDFGHPENRDMYIKHHHKGRLLQRHPEAVWPCKFVYSYKGSVSKSKQ